MGPAASTAHELSVGTGAQFTPAGVEPRGDEGGGLGREPPATRPSWLRRTRDRLKGSVWAPVALKLIGLALGMLALAGVGVVSILSGAGGVQVPLSSMLGSDIHAAWLANTPAASAHALTAVSPLAASSASTAAAAPSAAVLTASGDAAGTGTGGSAGMTQDGKVILNLASSEDLRHLPGVGQKRADAILALRARLGRFKQVSDLLRVKGIGVRGLKKILPHVLLDAPKPAA